MALWRERHTICVCVCLVLFQVLLRDSLRREEGSVPAGYTVTELLLLARSTAANHRSAALHMLADLLHLTRPRCSDLAPGGQPVSRYGLCGPDHLKDRCGNAGGGGM